MAESSRHLLRSESHSRELSCVETQNTMADNDCFFGLPYSPTSVSLSYHHVGSFLLWLFLALSNDPKILSVLISIFTFWSSIYYLVTYSLDYYAVLARFTFGSSWYVQAIGPTFLVLIVIYWMKDPNVIVVDDLVVGVELAGAVTTPKDGRTRPRLRLRSSSVVRKLDLKVEFERVAVNWRERNFRGAQLGLGAQ